MQYMIQLLVTPGVSSEESSEKWRSLHFVFKAFYNSKINEVPKIFENSCNSEFIVSWFIDTRLVYWFIQQIYKKLVKNYFSVWNTSKIY